MTFFSHSVAGLAVGELVSKTINHSSNHFLILGISLLFSLLPDANILWQNFKNHHKDFTHYPLFWLIFVLVLMVIEKIFFYNTIISLLIFLNLVMHFFLDSFGFRNGVCLLYPFSKKEYSLTKIQLYQKLSRKELFDLYIHNGNLFLEAYVVVFGGVMLLAF